MIRIHSTVIIPEPETNFFGKDIVIHPYTQILAGARIDNFSVIGHNCFIGKDVIIGKHCKIQGGCFIPEGVMIGDYVFIGPNTVFCNVKYPITTVLSRFEETKVDNNVMIGANSTILSGITIGADAIIGAGSVVTKSVKCGITIYGNPAKEHNA